MTSERIEMDQSGYSVPPPVQAGTVQEEPSTVTKLGSAAAWRWLPLLLVGLLSGPGFSRALSDIIQPGYVTDPVPHGGPLEQGLLAWLGASGPALLAPVILITLAGGVWLLGRSLGAPRWAAAIAAAIAVIMPATGLAPDVVSRPDDAAFGAAMAVVMAFTVRATARLDGKALAIAFVVAIIAAWLRPWAAWPAIAVLLAVVLLTREMEERPWCGAIAALCWGPGLFLAQLFGETDGFRSGLVSSDSSAERLSQGLASTLEASTSTPPDLWGQALSLLATATPLVVLAGLAAVGLAVAWLLGRLYRIAALSAAIFLAVSILGALGYGDVQAARQLLDPMLLGLAAALGVIAPQLWERFRERASAVAPKQS